MHFGKGPSSPKGRFSLETADSTDSVRGKEKYRETEQDMHYQQQQLNNLTRMDTASSPPRQRRPQLVRVPTTPTRYMEMLLHLDKISPYYNIIAAASTWIILAAFLVVPGTFTSFKNSQAFKDADDGQSSDIAHAILHSVAHIGLLWVSGVLAVLGAFGCTFLWFRWRNNYVWIINRVFMPALLNSVAGLLTTVVNVYTAQKGVWSITAKITAIVTGSSIVIAGTLFFVYFLLLDKVKAKHQRELDSAYRSGLENMFKRKAKKSVNDPMVVV